MLIFVALLYFCLACSIIWLVLFPTGRVFFLQFVVRFGQQLEGRLARWHRARMYIAGAAGRRMHGWARHYLKVARRHLLLLAIGVTIVVIPPAVALLMSKPGMLPGYEAGDALPDLQVAALLKGEQLVPPAALPPLAFTTTEVEQVRPMLVDASRNWAQLHPDFEQRLLLAFKIMKEKHGYEMALLEGYRSPARQNLLAAMGSHVTNAAAFQSYHQYGLAADCAFWREGRLVISERDPWAMRGYRLYGEVTESLGLVWGGRWTMMDFGHTELRLRGTLRN
jgi:peptidoglycan L-alanyl-D-glutamate endopeptidase CwlK